MEALLAINALIFVWKFCLKHFYFHWASNSDLMYFSLNTSKISLYCLLAVIISNKKPTTMCFCLFVWISFSLAVVMIVSLSLITMMFQIFCLFGCFCFRYLSCLQLHELLGFVVLYLLLLWESSQPLSLQIVFGFILSLFCSRTLIMYILDHLILSCSSWMLSFGFHLF